MTEFDVEGLSDPAIRREYGFLEVRARSLAQAVTTGYRRASDAISFRFVDERAFNAYARVDERGAYHVELNAAVPLFNLILFYRLMSDARFLPELDASGALASHFTLPFILDPADFETRQDWAVGCNELRAFAAGTLADLCNSFVLCHEMAHVVCGHCEGIRHYEGAEAIAELVAPDRDTALHVERRLAWERDADLVAGGWLAQFVRQLAEEIGREPRTTVVFGDADGFHLEKTTAISVAALFAFFCYLQGARRALNKANTHPHPHLRALYLKNVLVSQLREDGAFDNEEFHRQLDARLEDAMLVLEAMGLFRASDHSPRVSRAFDREQARLERLQNRHRAECAAWCWIPWPA